MSESSGEYGSVKLRRNDVSDLLLGLTPSEWNEFLGFVDAQAWHMQNPHQALAAGGTHYQVFRQALDRLKAQFVSQTRALKKHR